MRLPSWHGLLIEHSTNTPMHREVDFDETLAYALDPSIAFKGVEDLPMSTEAWKTIEMAKPNVLSQQSKPLQSSLVVAADTNKRHRTGCDGIQSQLIFYLALRYTP